MSYLNGPRINFWGGGRINVDTANNTGNGLVDLVTANVISPLSDEAVIAALRQPTTSNGQNYYTVAGWNYYGDHQVTFAGTKVSTAGLPGAVSAQGGLIGLPVFLLGSIDPTSGEGPYGGAVMVDLDPTSSQTSQIYVGGFQIGNEQPKLLVRSNQVCHSQFLGLRYNPKTTNPPYLTPGSAFANGTFQVGFPKAAIVSYDHTDPILCAIIEAPGAIGIVLRFSLFEFMPGMSTDALQKNYQDNRNDANPSLGRVIGTVGSWLANEPATCPPGRLLQNATLGGAQGLAHLDVAGHRLTLDLVSALQGLAIRQDATAITAPIGPNVDYGDLQIGTANGVLVTTPSLPDTYYLYGGIYDVSLDPSATQALAARRIMISSSKNSLGLAEIPLRIYSNQRNIYLNEQGNSATLELEVLELGGPVRSDVTLVLTSSVSGTLPDPKFLNFPPSVTVPQGRDHVVFTVTDNGGAPGFLALNIAGGTAGYFINFRKYPKDDFSAVIAAGAIPWALVYQQCLRFYYVLFPAMSKRIPLNDEPTIEAVGGEILKRTSALYRDTTLYMPLTRSLSPGKVNLLRAFLQPPADS